jgi:cyclopropane fatty-acyl-phospholipid synthase-like methyltransferase
MSRDLGEVVQAGYDQAVDQYERLEQAHDQWPRSRWLTDLERRLDPGSAVLDLGCATGVPVAARLAQSCRVSGVDISPVQIEQASTNVPEGDFICADLQAVTFPDGHFDAVVSLYTFDHVPRDHYAEQLNRIYGWLRPGGFLLLSIEDRDEPGTVAPWLGVDMHFSMFDADATRRLVLEAGFTIERTAVEDQIEGQVEIPYTWILARRPVESAPHTN